jgi:hypothetical protein
MSEDELKEILSKLDNHEKRLSALEGIKEDLKKPREILQDNGFFDVDGEQLTLTKKIGEKTKEITQNIALLVLYGYKKQLKIDKVLGTEIRRNVATHQVPLENFGTYIKEIIPQQIIRQGKVGSVKTTYKLTPFGEAKAKSLSEQLGKDEG